MHASHRALILSLLLGATASAALAQGTATPVIDQRQANQQQRINQGVASGELNKREARRLQHQQNAVQRAENKAKADGVVTAGERKKITKMQDQTSKNIARQKHDAQTAKP